MLSVLKNKTMDKDRFFQLVKQHKTGERVRVLFDIIMELIEASPDAERVDFWGLLKAKLQGEQDAMAELTKGSATVNPPKATRKKSKTVEVFEGSKVPLEDSNATNSIYDKEYPPGTLQPEFLPLEDE